MCGSANRCKLPNHARGFSIAFSLILCSPIVAQDRYKAADGKLRVALAQQPLGPNGPSKGPDTMATGGIQKILADLGATVRVERAQLTPFEDTEYGGWKKLGMALGHFADIVRQNEADGYFTVGLLATCPSMPGLVAGLQKSGPGREQLRIGMLWLDAHPDINTPETTRSGSLGGMPVAVATGRALQRMRLDAGLEPAMSDQHMVMGGVRLTDPLEQDILDNSRIEQVSVDDLRNATPAVSRSSIASIASATSCTSTSTWMCWTRRKSRRTETRCRAVRRAGNSRRCSSRSSRGTRRPPRSDSRRFHRPMKEAFRSQLLIG